MGNRPSRDDQKGAGGFSEEVEKQISDDLNILLVIVSSANCINPHVLIWMSRLV